jgi:hypothetical protein
MKIEERFETSALKIQRQGNHQKERIQRLKQDESSKDSLFISF